MMSQWWNTCSRVFSEWKKINERKMAQQMILMPSTLSHGNHARYYSRNQVHTMTWRWPCATACSCSKDSYRSRDTGGRKERAWTTHSSRAVITLAGCARRAPQQWCWGWLIIIAIRSHLRYVAYICPTLYRIRRRGSRTICASTVLPSRRFYSVIHPLL